MWEAGFQGGDGFDEQGDGFSDEALGEQRDSLVVEFDDPLEALLCTHLLEFMWLCRLMIDPTPSTFDRVKP